MKSTDRFFNDEDLVSVLLPISRMDRFFGPAFESLLSQTYQNLEIIILANGMHDDEFDRLRSVCQVEERVKLIRLGLRGLAFALNYGISIARGALIARMDSDDISLSNRIQLQVEFLKKNPDHGVVGGRVVLIDENGTRIPRSYRFFEKDEEIRRVLPYRNPLCHPALMFRKAALLSIDGYKFGFMSEDHEMFLRLMSVGVKFHNIDVPIFKYRRHSAQITDISKSWRHFAEISGFMLMHFLLAPNLKFLVGAGAVFPPIRKLRNMCLRASR